MTYRLERLPSQQTPSFDPILALAEQTLARAGLQRNDDSGQWVVQLGAQAGFTRAATRLMTTRPGPLAAGAGTAGVAAGACLSGLWRWAHPRPCTGAWSAS